MTDEPAPVLHGIKGFDMNLQCRSFQFEIGKTYTHDGKVEACNAGFHAVTGHPLAVLQYYAPGTSRYCRVEQSGATHSDDAIKTASAILKVGQEIGLRELTLDAVKWVMDRAKPEGEIAKGENGLATASGYSGAATASGNSGAATASGNSGAATASGNYGAATASGYYGAATASGNYGAATASGHYGAATASGHSGAATASGYSGAATASGHSGAATASGHYGAATASGYYGAATASGDSGAATASGDYGAATASGRSGAATASGDYGAATASGYASKVSGAHGNALFSVERGDWDGKVYPILSVACGIVGRDGIKPDTWYRAKGGKLVEVEAAQ